MTTTFATRSGGCLTLALGLALGVTMLAAVSAAADGPRAVDDGPPSWAFAMDPPATSELQRKIDDNIVRHVPNSKIGITRKEALDLHNVPDWHPETHPPAPGIVMHGRMQRPAACAFCHLPNGMGIPEDAPLAGLTADYMIRQIKDYQSGVRGSARPEMVSFHGMAVTIASVMTDQETKEAADYYASLKPVPWIKVIEAKTVPKTRVIQYTVMPDPAGGTEPIGNRIIETPIDPVLYDLHDDGVGFVAYVPPGSIKKGEVLAQTGADGQTTPCVTCHGVDLKGGKAPGGEPAPHLAGGSPSNIVRQLYNFQSGARGGPNAELMIPIVPDLSTEDMVNLAAYISSLEP